MKILFMTSNLGFFKTHFYESWILGCWHNEGIVISGKTGSSKIEKNIEDFLFSHKVNYKKYNISGGLNFSFSELYHFYKLLKFFRKKKFDMIRTSSPKFGLLGLIIAYFYNTKIICIREK